MLEQALAETRLFVESLDLVANHFVVFIAFLHLDFEKSIEVLVQLNELLDHLVIDVCDFSVDVRVITFLLHLHLKPIANRGQNSVFLR